jgi:hypothetical protein
MKAVSGPIIEPLLSPLAKADAAAVETLDRRSLHLLDQAFSA